MATAAAAAVGGSAVVRCDYLVVGAGASAMSFVDELVHNSRDLTVVIVDRRPRPGGHWIDAYPFVRLHQPAAFYGVNSRALGSGGDDLSGKSQICAYYEDVMRGLMATGRVAWLPQTEYSWRDGELVSLLDGDLRRTVLVRRKLVDATAMSTQVPSTHPPSYAVASDVHHLPLNDLASVASPWKKYVVIGAGKTGVDALLFLLRNGVNPGRIKWVVPNDCWYILRDSLEGNGGLFGPAVQQTILSSSDLDDMYLRFEENKLFARVDKSVKPAKMRAATASSSELDDIRQVKDVVRMGRISSITATSISFKSGAEIPTDKETLHVDASRNGTLFYPVGPIYSPGRITLQLVQTIQPTYSGSVIAALELRSEDDNWKNSIIPPMAAPQDLPDWFSIMALSLENRLRIRKALGFRWLWCRRLSAHNLTALVGRMKGLLIGALYFFGVMDANNPKVIRKLKAMLPQAPGHAHQ